ncbi:MAG: TOBE domain-containing protein [Myxococcales bacterium]
MAKTKIGARNRLTAEVTGIKKGGVMCQVNLRLEVPGDMASVMTLDSLADLKLKKGDRVDVVVKAVHVLLMKQA